MTEGWGQLRVYERHNLSLLLLITETRRWEGHVARVGAEEK